jgi:hypothetical protein
MLSSRPDTHSISSSKKLAQWVRNYVKPALLPVLISLIPTFYHYSNNVIKLTPVSLYRMLIFNGIVALVVYAVCLIFLRRQPVRAAIAASIFLVFFNIYGLLYRYLINLDLIRIRHYTLLPLTILLAIYLMVLLTRWEEGRLALIWKYLSFIAGLLVAFNLMSIVPGELKKLNSDPINGTLAPQTQIATDQKKPDIYYIVLDEFEGLQGMREYWNYQGVDEFASFLKDKGFYVAENSHGSSIDTLHQLAIRLNYRDYILSGKYAQTYFNDIANNKVVAFLKSIGYTTVVFDETKMGYPSAKPIQADILYEYGSSAIPKGDIKTLGFSFDEFGELVIDNTMLYAVSEKYKSNSPMVSQHNRMVFFTVDNIASEDVPSPKFVYVHLLLPHNPFMYNENGDIVDNSHFFNWDYYIDNYKFTIKLTERMIENILQASDPENPPVIILQSDHGARNIFIQQRGSKILSNYPEKYKTLILNAMYLPGYNNSDFSQDMNPINTFPIIFNYLFNTKIPLVK